MKIASRSSLLRNLCGTCAMAMLPASASMITLQAGGTGPETLVQDAMLVQDNANDNYGARTDLEVGVLGNGQVRTTVMRFDVTDPAAGLYSGTTPQFLSITAITLTLTTTASLHNAANMDLRISAGTEAQGDWLEGNGTAAASTGDAGFVTYSERREGQSTGWLPDSNYTRGTGDGVLATVVDWPGANTTFNIPLNPLPGETLTDLVDRWAVGENEGLLLNDVNRSGFARWFIHSSESASLNLRPALTIEYVAIPEPDGLFLMGGLAGFFIRRKRRK